MAKKVNKKKHVIKWASIMAAIAAVIIAVNVIATSPMLYGIITMALGGARFEIVGGSGNGEYYASTAKTQEEAIQNTEATIIPEAVTEGIVLLNNDDHLLPLSATAAKKARVSLFGYDSVDVVVGGTGSGQSFNRSDLKIALEEDHFEVNEQVWNASKSNQDKAKRGSVDVIQNTSDFTIKEIPSSAYASTESTYASYDTAIYMIGRMGGEAFDLPADMAKWGGEAGRHYLEMTAGEEELLSYLCEKFNRVVVIVNTAGNPFETDRIYRILNEAKKENASFRYATLFSAGFGSTGVNGVGEVLNGTVSPSGRMTDTWVNDITSDPTYVNAGDFRYADLGNVAYVEYEEGIYVGYRYYETMDAVKNDGGKWYNQAVAYPFGYGLSYTSFSQTMSEVSVKDDVIEFDVTVKNTGKLAGKEVVQIYQTAPYTAGGIEKSAKALIDFAKTKELKAGEEEKVHFSFHKEALASYDHKVEKAYVIDGGEYTLIAGKNAHEAYDSKTVTLERTVFSGDKKRPSDLIAATNRLEDMTEYMDNATTQLTRADGFAGGVSAPEKNAKLPVYSSKYLTKSLSETLTSTDPAIDYTYDGSIYQGSKPTTGADNGIELIQLRGLSYDDPLWDPLLDEITEKEMTAIIGTGGYRTMAIKSINKPATKDPDGPAGFSSFMDASIKGSSIPAATLIACTWNKELAQKLGEAIGEEGLLGGYSGWYAPATNMHRYPLSGRHFEYYSEDPVLAGHMTTYVVQGAAEKGVYSYIKHFALNEQETNRKTNNNVATWANEQAVREIYLKPFEMCVKNAKVEIRYNAEVVDENGNKTYEASTKEMNACTAVMSSYNRIGAIWAGGRYSVMTTMLRHEWGFNGMVVTDYFTTAAQNMTQMLRTGNDLALTTISSAVPLKTAEDVIVARRAVKNILYTVVNSNAMNGYSYGVYQVELMPVWEIVMISVSAVLGLCWIAWGTILILDGTGKTHFVYEFEEESEE
ncbi:MAG: glycoside hydrolase family 3 C-terminal domain-containing protein [Clostridia bacterium]|nr:glycoside hydrolase family 3 C-terminal domain-containing protein [Clostridia bacterium]